MSRNEEDSSYAQEMGLEPVPLSVAALAVLLAFKDRHVPMLVSESGIGKTAMIRALGRLQEMDVLTYMLAHCEPSDLKGPMWPTEEGTFKTLPDGRIPFVGMANELVRRIIFFDEPNRAEQTTLNAVFSAIGDRRMGGHIFGPNVLVALAMNPPDGDYAVTSSFTTDPAMRRRTCQIAVHFSVGEFLRFMENPETTLPHLDMEPFIYDPAEFEARRNRPFHPSVIGFLRASPDLALDRKSREAGKVYACPATWEAVSDTLYTLDELDLDMSSPLIQRGVFVKLAGHVNAVTARAVLDFHEHASRTIEPSAVLRYYEEGSAVYRAVHRLINKGDNAQLSTLMNGIALTFFSGDKYYEQLEAVTPRLAQLYSDLPTTQSSLLTSRLTAKGREWHPDAQYPEELNQLYAKLALNPVYRKYKEHRSKAYEEGEDDMKKALAEAEAVAQEQQNQAS